MECRNCFQWYILLTVDSSRTGYNSETDFDEIIKRNNMIYIIDISSNGIETEKISDDLYQNNDFTLTVKAVNDAPVLLQPLDIFQY